MTVDLRDEFWWSDDQGYEHMYVYVLHDPPVTDDVEPLEKTCYASLDDHSPSATKRLYPATFLAEWGAFWSVENIHRSCVVYSASGDVATNGPLLVDIDNIKEDIDDALEVTRRAIDYLSSRQAVRENSMRVSFSGRKGFHIEVHPESVRLPWRDVLSGIRDFARQTSGQWLTSAQTNIDPPHDYIRLRESTNAWISDDGTVTSRCQVPLTQSELAHITSDQILGRSEQKESANG